MESNIVQLRKKGGIRKILSQKNGATINPMVFRSQTKDPNEEGVLEGEYNGVTLMDTKHFICPHWGDLKKKWDFGGSVEDLARLVKDMKLVYNSNHKNAGQDIKNIPGEDGGEIRRLTDFNDPVFRNAALYGKLYMSNGRVNFNRNNPIEEFLYLCYKGSTMTEDKSEDRIVSPYITAGTRYEMVSPKKETQIKRRDANKEIKAIQLLATMDGNEEKMRAIAVIMGLPQYSKSTDANGVFLLLKDAAQNTNKSAKFGDRSWQDRFIELASMEDSDLNFTSKIVDAQRRGIIRKKTDGYLFNGEKLDISNDIQLMAFFKDDINQEKYLELEDLLKARK